VECFGAKSCVVHVVLGFEFCVLCWVWFGFGLDWV
jgi:hypothetical protein